MMTDLEDRGREVEFNMNLISNITKWIIARGGESRNYIFFYLKKAGVPSEDISKYITRLRHNKIIEEDEFFCVKY